MEITLLILAILPVLVLSIFIYVKDKFQKEPIGMLLKAFFMGALSIVPAIVLESFLTSFTPIRPLSGSIYTGFVVAGFSEELCKYLMLFWAVWKSPHFDEYFDGIVYATFVSLGFACFENISYVFGQDTFYSALTTGGVRAIVSVPGHFLFGVVMGYYFALAKFQPANRNGNLFKALLYPVLFHGTFDALLMVSDGLNESVGIISSVLFIIFIWFDIRLWKIGSRRLQKLQAMSENQSQNFNHNDTDSNNWNDPNPPYNNSLENIDWNV